MVYVCYIVNGSVATGLDSMVLMSWRMLPMLELITLIINQGSCLKQLR